LVQRSRPQPTHSPGLSFRATQNLFQETRMSRIVLFLILCGTVAMPAVVAQDHVAVGAYADYFRLSQTDTNFAGLGGRLGVGLGHRVMLEAEMSYDFNQVFTEDFANGG